MKRWKIYLKNGESLIAPNYHHLVHGGRDAWAIKEVTTKKTPITVGHLWWKKEEIRENKDFQTRLVIPYDNILMAELVEVTNA